MNYQQLLTEIKQIELRAAQLKSDLAYAMRKDMVDTSTFGRLNKLSERIDADQYDPNNDPDRGF